MKFGVEGYHCEELEMRLAAVKVRLLRISDLARRKKALAAYGLLEEGLFAFIRANDRVVWGYHDRDDLVAEQIRLLDFHGSAHYQYHVQAMGLQGDYSTLMGAAKTLLNRLALLWGSSLPHTRARAIKDRSFGAFLSSMEKPLVLGKAHESFRIELLHRGKLLDNSVCSYRDKAVEHARADSSGWGGLSTGTNGVRRIRNPTDERVDRRKGSRMFERPFIKHTTPDGDWYDVHVAPARKLKPGKVAISSEDLVTSDGATGHFETWGSHWHHFVTPKLAGQLPALSPLMTTPNLSPDAFGTTGVIENYLEFAVVGLSKVLGR